MSTFWKGLIAAAINGALTGAAGNVAGLTGKQTIAVASVAALSGVSSYLTKAPSQQGQ